MQRPLLVVRLFLLSSALTLTACGPQRAAVDGGVEVDAGPELLELSGAALVPNAEPIAATTTSPQEYYTFDVVAGTPYLVTSTSSAGDVWLEVIQGVTSAGAVVGLSMNSAEVTTRDAVSFVPTFSGPVTVKVTNVGGSSSYTLQALVETLNVSTAAAPVAAITASTYNTDTQYRFAASAGAIYQVQLTPQSGDANLALVKAAGSVSVGSSLLAGVVTDAVTFKATGTEPYFIQVASTMVETTYTLKVIETTEAPDLGVVLNSAFSDGVNVTVNFTLHNGGLTATTAGSFVVSGWADSPGAAPAFGAVGQASNTTPIPVIAAGASSAALSLTIPCTEASGTAYVIVDTANAIEGSNDTKGNNVSNGVAWTRPEAAPVTYGFETGGVPANFLLTGTGGAANWFVDTTQGSGGSARSLKAGVTPNNGTSCFSVGLTTASSISFDYRVSSESGYDFLKFYVDGKAATTPATWSGISDWAPVPAATLTNAVGVAPGFHIFKWCYTKDGSASAGSDTAWVDNIVVK